MRNATHTSILFTFVLSPFSSSLVVVSLAFPSPPPQLAASASWRSSSSVAHSSSSSPTSTCCRRKSNDDNASFLSLMSRRRSIYISISSLVVPLTTHPTPTDASPDEINKKKGTVTVTINGPQQKLGLEVYDVTVGSSPPKPVVAIKRVVASNLQDKLQPGMICREYTSVQELQARLQGPFPMTIQFENLAAGGDAYDDFGKPIVTAEDALQMTAQPQQQSPQRDQSLGNRQVEEYSITVLDRPSNPQVCTNIQSRRNDVLEIQYEAHLNSINGIVYDSSESRGTGQPYQMVLGSYDMIPGVDQGLYDMCVGETRVINIPSQLAYGTKGNKLYRIPPNTPLVWKVELVSVNSVRKGDTRTRDDIEQRVEYY